MWLTMLRSVFILLNFATFVAAGRLAPAARALLQRINPSADPCEDFYEYACGNYVKNSVMPADTAWKATIIDQDNMNNRRLAAALSRPIRQRDIEAVRKAKCFYQSCIHYDPTTGIQSALDYLNSVGGTWPTFDPSWTESQFDLESSLAAATKQDSPDLSGTTLGSIIKMWVFRDEVEPNNAINFIRPTFLVPDIVLTPELMAEIEDLIIDILVLLGAPPATAQADGMEIAAFEFDLQALPFTGFVKAPLDVAQGEFPYIDWLKYLNKVFEETDITIEETDLAWFYSVDYYSNLGLGEVLNDFSKRTVANVIKWRMFTLLVPVMPDSIRERFLRLNNLVNGVEALPDRRTHCVRIVNGNVPLVATNYGMGQAVSRLFVECYFNKAIKRKNERIGAEVKAIMENAIEESDWLSDVTKATLKLKLDVQIEEFVYPETTFNDDYLNNYYRDFDIQKERLVENFISTALGNTRRTLEMLVNPEKNKWIIPPSVVNAWSSFWNVHILLTAAFLQPGGLMFDLSYPMAVNFAGAGFFTAHEILHTVGPGGMQYNEEGIFVGDIYSPASSIAFGQRAQCLVDQYSEYDVPFTGGLQVNGAMTVGEGMADEVGLKFSYLAYDKLGKMKGEEKLRKLPLTARQLFFVAYAHNFCTILRPERAELLAIVSSYPPGKWRTNGPLRNLPEFAEVFNCPAGSFMNPDERCTVF